MAESIKEFLRKVENVKKLLPNHIQIESFLAEGGQGVVYRGLIYEEDAAIKVYFPGQIQTRIEREINALTNLDNPHIVKLLWSGSIEIGDTNLSVVGTKFIPGTDLSSLIANKGQVEADNVAKIIYDICDAINSMWEMRIVHRDLKPPNILIRPNGRACVIDLGVGRHISRTPLTATGVTWGTWGYMSPEQARAITQLTCKSDIFSLGVIAIECFLGRHPTRNDQKLLFAMGYDRQLPAEIRNWKFAGLVQKMLHPRQTARPLPLDIMLELSNYS
jgi:serine/threonine-protein kinase